MQKTIKRKELLDVLADSVGCSYLSDLTHAETHPRLRQTLCRMAAGDYSLHEWNDAAEYITRQTSAFATAEQARTFLIRYTSSPNDGSGAQPPA